MDIDITTKRVESDEETGKEAWEASFRGEDFEIFVEGDSKIKALRNLFKETKRIARITNYAKFVIGTHIGNYSYKFKFKKYDN